MHAAQQQQIREFFGLFHIGKQILSTNHIRLSSSTTEICARKHFHNWFTSLVGFFLVFLRYLWNVPRINIFCLCWQKNTRFICSNLTFLLIFLRVQHTTFIPIACNWQCFRSLFSISLSFSPSGCQISNEWSCFLSRINSTQHTIWMKQKEMEENNF